MKLFIKISIFFFFFNQISMSGQKLYNIPEQVFDLYEMTGYERVFFDTVFAFEISEFITLKEYKDFLLDIKKDYPTKFYLKMLPDSTIAENSLIYEKYLTEKKYEKYPVLGVSWESAMYFCDWKTRKDSTNNNGTYYYRLPFTSEWLAAYRYLESHSIRHDFNFKYADILITSKDESGYSSSKEDEKYGYLFDYAYMHKKDDCLAVKRKKIIGSSYAYEMNSFMECQPCIYAEDGSRYASFRLVKVEKTNKNFDDFIRNLKNLTYD